MNTGDDRPTVPPVRLPAEAELASAALASPLLSRAARLARWAEPGVAVGEAGELAPEQCASAVAYLGLDAEEDGAAAAEEAWYAALDTGLVEIAEGGALEEVDAADDHGGTAVPGPELVRLTDGGPAEVLRIWSGGLDAALTNAASLAVEDLLVGPGGAEEVGWAGAGTPDGAVPDPDGDERDLDERDLDELDLDGMAVDGMAVDALDADQLDWEMEREGEALDSALANLYVFSAVDESVVAGGMVPLPLLAAALVLPDSVAEPSEEDLGELTAVMLRLDEQFRALVETGLLEYQPVDDELLVEEEPEAVPAAFAVGDGEGDEEEALARYGLVRLTPLGIYGVRQRLLDAGVEAPLVGDLAGAPAGVLLATLPGHPPSAARAEAERWVGGREPLAAARDLLAAARGVDPEGPVRRLGCQLALSLLDRRAEPAVREVLDDGELGGLARVWLAEHGSGEVPPPSETMVFWLTIDTLAAQLTAFAAHEDQEELQDLVVDLTAQHSGFFDRVWRTDHPAAAEVLEAMGRLHPDRDLAKQARKAAFRSRSRA